MGQKYSVAHLTALGLSPPDLIDAAAEAGYDYVGLRLNRTTEEEPLYDLIHDRQLMRATRSRLQATGIQVWDVEVARLDPPRDHLHYRNLLETGAELGARHVIGQLPDPDHQRAVDRFAALCDLARPLGLSIDLEFVAWWEDMPDLSSAARVLRDVDRPNAGILIDFLHFDRSRSTGDLLRSLPRSWFTWVHVCDAPASREDTLDTLVKLGRRERLFPGDGGIDTKGILDCLPDDIVYALEIPGETLAAEIGYTAYIRRALQAAKRHLDGTD